MIAVNAVSVGRSKHISFETKNKGDRPCFCISKSRLVRGILVA